MKTLVKIFCVILVVTPLLFVGSDAASPWCDTPAVCFNSTHQNLCVGYEKGYIHKWDTPIACPVNSFCNGSRCQEQFPGPPYIYGLKPCNIYGFKCAGRDKFSLCKYDSRNNSISFGWEYHCPSNTQCDENYPFHCKGIDYTATNYWQPPPAPPPGFIFSSPSPPVSPVAPTYHVTKDECKGKDFLCIDSKSYVLCRYMGDGTIRPMNEKQNCPKGRTCHKNFNIPCAVSGASSFCKYPSLELGIFTLLIVMYFRTGN